MSLLNDFAAEETERIEAEATAGAPTEKPEEQKPTTDEKPEETPEEIKNPAEKEEKPEDADEDKETNAQGTEQEKPVNRGSRFANEELQRFNEYVLKTGKSWEDFQALNKPTDQIDSKDLLRQYYSEKEGMSEKEVNYELSNLIVDENNDDFDFEDEKTQLRREALLERELRKAREWREQNVSEVLSTLDTVDTNNMTVEEYQEQMKEEQKLSVDDYRQRVYSALPDIKTMEVEVNGQKVLFTPDEEFGKQLKSVTEDFGTVVNKYYDESGKLKDVAGWIDLVSWADETTRNAKIKFIVDQAIAHDRAERSKERRNVNNASQTVIKATDGDDEAQFNAWREKKRASSLD